MTLTELALSWKAADIKAIEKSIALHRRECGESCFNGDQMQKQVDIWKTANGHQS